MDCKQEIIAKILAGNNKEASTNDMLRQVLDNQLVIMQALTELLTRTEKKG